MAWVENGVWVSLRLDSTLRLYHAKTMQHLQYLDIEPFITRMLGTSNLGLSLIRVSALNSSPKRLWIGTGNGVILSLPFEDSSDGQCNLAEAQFSFHGHRNAIKFFLKVPSQVIQKQTAGKSSSSSTTDPSYEKVEAMLMLSGGHGYIDFRIGDATSKEKSSEQKFEDMKNEVIENKNPSKNERSHLIVWQVNTA